MHDLAAFALAALWQSGIVAGAAILAARATRRAPARMRHAMLVAALIAAAVLPVFGGGLKPALHFVNVIAVVYLLLLAHAVISFAIALRATIVLRRSARGRGLVRTSDRLSVPVTIGAFRPMILLPAGLADRRAVLAHELAHVRRRDALVQTLLEIVTLPIAFHPLVRMLKREIVLAREMACDELVTAARIEPRRYARALLAVAFGHVDALEERLRALRDPHRRYGRLAAATVTLGALVFGLVHVHAALLSPHDFSGRWVLDREATDFGPVGPYDAFTQTITSDARTLAASQTRRHDGRVERVTWRVTIDGVTRRVDRGIGSARWDGSAIVLDLRDGDHWEFTRASLTRDRDTLVCDGEMRNPRRAGRYRFVFRRTS